MKRRERMRWVVALGIGLALHALLLLVPLSRPGDPDAGRSIEVAVRWLPPPQPLPARRAPPDQALEALPPRPAASEAPTAVHSAVPSEPVPAPEPIRPPGVGPTVSAATLMAEPLLDDRPDARALFGRPRTEADPAPTLAWRMPEREGLDDMLNRPLPDLPFADPELVDFMYAPGFTGEAHRLFDTITPEFGWTSKTGFKIRCRFVLVVIGCGWGR